MGQIKSIKKEFV